MRKHMMCEKCGKLLEVELIFKDGVLSDTNPPLLCECGSAKFIARFEIDPTEWSGVIGTNG